MRDDVQDRAERLTLRLMSEVERLHGMLLTRDGVVVTERYAAPGFAREPHRLFSVSKSVTSLAVGILAGDGKLELDRTAASYFPEWVGPETDGNTLAVTLRHILRMETCHKRRAYRAAEDECWAKAFFTVPPDHAPGTVFGYDASGTQVLAQLCCRVADQPLMQFVRERLFDRIGIIGPMAWLTDPSGVEQGGSGLCMTLRDMSRLANFCMTDGQGIVPADYLRMALSRQTDTAMRANPEERHGYGYQFWMTRHGYAMYGMKGQLAIMAPKEHMTLCTIGDTEGDEAIQRIYDLFFEMMLDM